MSKIVFQLSRQKNTFFHSFTIFDVWLGFVFVANLLLLSFLAFLSISFVFLSIFYFRLSFFVNLFHFSFYLLLSFQVFLSISFVFLSIFFFRFQFFLSISFNSKRSSISFFNPERGKKSKSFRTNFYKRNKQFHPNIRCKLQISTTFKIFL